MRDALAAGSAWRVAPSDMKQNHEASPIMISYRYARRASAPSAEAPRQSRNKSSVAQAGRLKRAESRGGVARKPTFIHISDCRVSLSR